VFDDAAVSSDGSPAYYFTTLLLYVSSYYYTLHLCPHTTILLYTCPHTTIYAVFHDAAAISDGSPAHEIAIARYLRLNRALIEP
jgi:hypothetical protein